MTAQDDCDWSSEPCCDGCASGLGPCDGPGYRLVCVTDHPGPCPRETATREYWGAAFGDREGDL